MPYELMRRMADNGSLRTRSCSSIEQSKRISQIRKTLHVPTLTFVRISKGTSFINQNLKHSLFDPCVQNVTICLGLREAYFAGAVFSFSGQSILLQGI